jgi:protein-S-isoprenylcysteine O-methyltransferase Ste14
MAMRRSTAAAVSLAWGVALGGTFACLLPYLLNEWHFHRPLPYWTVAQVAGGLLICAGLIPIAVSFAEFIRADGTPVPVASPRRLVVRGSYRYVRNPIYAGFSVIMAGEVLLFGSPGLLEYTVVAWCIGAAAVRFYEEPVLARKFGAEYQDYRRAVRAWIPRLQPWTPGDPRSLGPAVKAPSGRLSRYQAAGSPPAARRASAIGRPRRRWRPETRTAAHLGCRPGKRCSTGPGTWR